MKIILICLLILVVAVFAGCGDSAETPSDTSTPTTTASSDTSPAPAGTPAAAPASTPTPATTASSTPTATTTEQPTTPTSTTTTTTATSTPTPTSTPEAITQEDIDTAKQVVFDYWVAFNDYDIEAVMSYCTDAYREEKFESLESDMGRMKTFGTTLGVEEEVDPVITPDNEIEIKIKLKTPLGSRHVLYHLTEVNGEWKICFSEEQ